MKDVNSRFGKGSLMKLGSQPDKVVWAPPSPATVHLPP